MPRLISSDAFAGCRKAAIVRSVRSISRRMMSPDTRTQLGSEATGRRRSGTRCLRRQKASSMSCSAHTSGGLTFMSLLRRSTEGRHTPK